MATWHPRRVIPYLLAAAMSVAVAYTAIARESAAIPLTEAEQAFIQKTYQSSRFGADIGKMAFDRAKDDRVRQFAKQLVRDHSQTNLKLAAFAKKRGVALSDHPTPEQQALKKRLADLTSTEFDEVFVWAMVDDQLREVDESEQQLRDATDTEFVQLVESALPILRKHLAAAEVLIQELVLASRPKPMTASEGTAELPCWGPLYMALAENLR
jgi:putative membrane protein